MTNDPSMKISSNGQGGTPWDDSTSAHSAGNISSHVPVWLGSRIKRLAVDQFSRGAVSADVDMSAP